jgi:probable F420-dependent oxidoreductase
MLVERILRAAMMMKIDRPLLTRGFAGAADAAAAAEASGFDGVFTFEGPHNPFYPLVAAAGATHKLSLSTGVAIALARNPMVVAAEAHDLQLGSNGRFTLGLGPQVRAHIERRFGEEADRPSARMREFVGALRAIFACWNENRPLEYEGEFYRHTLMTPMFHPGASPHGSPPILLAGVGPSMVRTAASVADGLIVHPFHTRHFLETVTIPTVRRALASAGRTPNEFRIVVQSLVVTSDSEEEYQRVREATRAQVAFYASTRAYRPVLEAEHVEAIHDELRSLSKQGRWSEMPGLVSDDILDRIAVCAPPSAAGRELVSRYGDFAERVAIATPFEIDASSAREVIAGVHG